MFTGILNESAAYLSFMEGGICTFASLLLGLWISIVYTIQGHASKNFKITLVFFGTVSFRTRKFS